jgi:hypothetical protein
MNSPKEKEPFRTRQKLIEEILHYLTEHPDAKDTLEGILKWWTPKSQAEADGKVVQEVLDFLVSKGWLIKREIFPSPKIYGLNKNQLKEIKVFLNELTNKTQGKKGPKP